MQFITVFGLLLLLSEPLSAAESYWYSCLKDDQPDHIITVYYNKAPADIPCRVNYVIGNQNEQLWSANVQTSYCETKSAEFIEQQQRWGWQCTRQAGEAPAK